MRNLVIFGIQNFADMAYHLFTTDSDYSVIGFTVNRQYMQQDEHMGLPVFPYEELVDIHPPGSIDIYVAVGLQQLNQTRAEIVDRVTGDGYEVASFVSSSTQLPESVTLYPNTMIMENVQIHPYVEIGKNCVIWSRSRIALKSSIEDNCWITSAVIGESCVLGRNTFVGLDVTILPNLSIGSYNVLGGGSLITANTKDYEVYKGAKAKKCRMSSKRLKNSSIIS